MQTDLHAVLKALKAIAPGAAITGNSTTDSDEIDPTGFESLEFLILSGAITDGGFTPSVRYSDDGFDADDNALDAADLLGTVAGATFAAADDSVAKKLGVNLTKAHKAGRTYKLRLTQAGATSGGIIGAVAVLGNPRYAPVA